MSGISIRINLDGASANLDAILRHMADIRPFYRSIGNHMVKSASDNFHAESGPDGTPWTPLKPATIRAHAKNFRSALSILRDRGLLAGSIKFEVEADRLRVGAVTPCAAIHQLGGTIQKAEAKRRVAGRRFATRDERPDGAEVPIRAHTITIPARPFLGLGSRDLDVITADAEDWLTR